MHVLLIGVNDYAQMPPLQYCEGDLEKAQGALSSLPDVKLAATLSTAESFVTRGDILESMKDVVARVVPGDSVLVFFSGHGDSNATGLLLCPSDYRPSLASESGVKLNALIEMASSVTGAVIVVLDCCRAALEQTELPKPDGEGAYPFTSVPFTSVRDNTFVFFSCRQGQNSYETADLDVQGSLFTHSWCEALKRAARKQGAVSLQQIFDDVEQHFYEMLHESYERWIQGPAHIEVQTPVILGGDFSKFCVKRASPARQRRSRRRTQ